MERKRMNPVLKWSLIGGGALLAISCLGLTLLGVKLLTGPQGGVKLGHEMEPYATRYITEHKLLEPGEEVLAYYDATILLNGTEAAILTNQRILYHKGGATTALRLENVSDIRHRYESLIGDVIEIDDAAGKFLKIEIAPLNQGETFKNALMSAWRRARKSPTPG